MARWRPSGNLEDVTEQAPEERRPRQRWGVTLAFLLGLTALALSGVMGWRVHQLSNTLRADRAEGASGVTTQVIQRLKVQSRALDAIKHDVKQVAERLARLEKRHQRQVEQSRRDMTKVRDEISAMLSTQQATFDRSLSELQKQVNQFAAEQESMKDLLGSYNDVIMKLQKNMVVLEKRLRGGERGASAAMQRIQALERALTGTQNSIESLRRQVRGLEATVRTMERAVDDLKAAARKSSPEGLTKPE